MCGCICVYVCDAGYFIYYTADNSQDDASWAREALDEDRLTVLIRDLSPDTTYYFKAQARNSKGYSPMSGALPYRTPARGNYPRFVHNIL